MDETIENKEDFESPIFSGDVSFEPVAQGIADADVGVRKSSERASRRFVLSSEKV